MANIKRAHHLRPANRVCPLPSKRIRTPQKRHAWQDMPTRNSRLMGIDQEPCCLAAMRQARQTTYQGELASLAADTLRGVMIDQDAPAAAKVSAARTALELAGDLGRAADDLASSKSLAEMSPDELARLIDRWEDERSSLATDVTPQNKTQTADKQQENQGI